jgi:hypothetical protein
MEIDVMGSAASAADARRAEPLTAKVCWSANLLYPGQWRRRNVREQTIARRTAPARTSPRISELNPPLAQPKTNDDGSR